MNKVNECTCPSGDGSLVHPCPAHPAVEQAGWDERAAFFKHLIGRHPAHETEIVRVVEHNHAAWKAWQARAALAQPSPKCATCNGSGFVDDGEINFYPDGTPFENGPVKCVKDCPDCAQPSPAQAVQAHDIPMLIASEHANPDYAMGWNDCRAKLIGAPSPAQAEGAQEVPSPVSQEYDRHLISLLRKGEALPGHQEEAADEIERLRDWNDHLNNTVLPNILNPNFLMLMKGGERLLDLCTKDGKFIGVSLNDMKDVFDWMVTHARIAPDHAALAQPSPAQAEAEAERPEVVAYADPIAFATFKKRGHEGGVAGREWMWAEPSAGLVAMSRTDECECIVGELRADRDSWAKRWDEAVRYGARIEEQRDAALARVASLESKLAELEKQDLVDVPGPDEIHQMAFEEGQPADDGDGYLFSAEEFDLFVQRLLDSCAAPVAQAQHSVPEGWYYDAPSQVEAVIIDIRGMWGEDDCPTYEDVAAALRRLLAAAPGKEGV
ncbi:hypothetical protein [Pseudomonas aeruginosa]|uniref:hypothetical protein n=1 Tax=Pseudomonas aeruginosa TaxID=287 RepID=UPI002D798B9E|nr:hypothetical protein [Pseudomonas aeruginosa]WRS36987.1 hypothetical protein U9S62_13225 [Pseudomonas aeruginosa]